MSGTDYITGLMVIIPGLALADLIVSLHRLLRARRIVRWDWLALATALVATLAVAISLFASFAETSAASYTPTLLAFLIALAELTLLFLMTCAALPDEVPADGIDLRIFYAENAPYFWSLFASLLAFFIVFDLTIPLLQAGRLDLLPEPAILLCAMLAAALALVFIPGRRLHEIGALGFLVAFAALTYGWQLSA